MDAIFEAYTEIITESYNEKTFIQHLKKIEKSKDGLDGFKQIKIDWKDFEPYMYGGRIFTAFGTAIDSEGDKNDIKIFWHGNKKFEIDYN